MPPQLGRHGAIRNPVRHLRVPGSSAKHRKKASDPATNFEVKLGCGAQVVVYDNGFSFEGRTSGSNSNDPDFPIFLEHADNISVGNGGWDFNAMLWHGQYSNNQAGEDDFELRIFAMSGGLPELAPFLRLPIGATRTVLPRGTPSIPYYEYFAEFSLQSLPPGDYALSIYNFDMNDAFWGWGTGDTAVDNTDGIFLISEGDRAWRHIPGGPNFSFTLYHVTIPEPRLPFSLGCAFVLLSLRRRRSHS